MEINYNRISSSTAEDSLQQNYNRRISSSILKEEDRLSKVEDSESSTFDKRSSKENEDAEELNVSHHKSIWCRIIIVLVIILLVLIGTIITVIKLCNTSSEEVSPANKYNSNVNGQNNFLANKSPNRLMQRAVTSYLNLIQYSWMRTDKEEKTGIEWYNNLSEDGKIIAQDVGFEQKVLLYVNTIYIAEIPSARSLRMYYVDHIKEGIEYVTSLKPEDARKLTSEQINDDDIREFWNVFKGWIMVYKLRDPYERDADRRKRAIAKAMNKESFPYKDEDIFSKKKKCQCKCTKRKQYERSTKQYEWATK